MSAEAKDAADKPAKKRGASTVFSVAVDADAHRQVTAQSKKLKVSQREYASAAIAYFAESGLDPTKEQRLGFAGVAEKVAVVEQNVRSQNHEIGTRLIQIIRTWEKNSYAFMQQQQASLTNYLELIESNILQHQVAVETNLLAPIVEQLFKVNIEAILTRELATRLYVGDTGLTDATMLPAERYAHKRKKFDSERTQRLKAKMSEFIESNPMPLPKPTRRPAVTPVPLLPLKPAATAQAAPLKS
jgi:hypothetical protein